MAAIRAREQGAKVTLVDKAAIERSGEAGQGSFFYSSYFDTGEPWDTAERYRQWWQDVRHGLVDMRVVDALVIRNQPVVQRYLENMGISLKDPRVGRYSSLSRSPLTRSVEHPRFFFRGEKVKPILAARVRELGAQVIERVQVTSLLTDDGRVVGATGFHNRDGDFYSFTAKTVVLALGSAERSYPTPNHNPFNNYRKPWHAGTGHAIAFKAGAELASLEFAGVAFVGRWIPGVVQCTLAEAGARLVNGLGEPLVERPDRPGEWGLGTGITYAAFRELIAGRGPIYLDARNISREKVQQAIQAQKDSRFWDIPLAMEYLERTGLDMSGGLVEMTPILATSNCSGSPRGVVIDEGCRTCVEGLYVAGDLANASDAVSGALTSGYVAGYEAAQQAAATGYSEPDELQTKEERERVFAPLRRKDGLKWDEFEGALRRVMTDHVGISRTALGLRSALNELKAADESGQELSASNLHELMRTHEVLDTLLLDRMIATAALERTESRRGFVISHHRADYPQQDDARWWGVAMIVKKNGEGMTASPRRMNSLKE
ncbi:MAG: FAD-binding protein [Chloroflexi bacterium]|nr:FAD-binding protein [Chloroflexota bacterium]